MTKEIDEGRAVDVVNMNFNKIFDNVPHGWLIQWIKIKNPVGIRDDLVVWIQRWFIHRIEGCGGRYSGLRSVTSGVPHGLLTNPYRIE